MNDMASWEGEATGQLCDRGDGRGQQDRPDSSRYVEAKEVGPGEGSRTAKSVACGELPGPLYAADAQRVMAIPLRSPLLLRQRVLGMAPPGGDRLQTGPIRHGNSEAVCVACAFDAQESGLLAGQFEHPLGSCPIPIAIDRRTHRSKNDCKVGWRWR